MEPKVRRELRQRENENRRSVPVNGPVVIGDRSNLGTYDVTYADGSKFPSKGVKVFDTAHEVGDTVVAIPRQDGYIALEGPKARPEVPGVLKDPCGSYLNGQLFSCPQRQPEEVLIMWGLGTEDVGGDNGKTKLYLINLISGSIYTVSEWDKKIPGCPWAFPDPDDYPDRGTQYPGWEVAYRWTETWTSYTEEYAQNTNGTFTVTESGIFDPLWVSINAQPPRLIVGSDSDGTTWQVVVGNTVVTTKRQDPNGIITTAMSLSGVGIAQMRGGPGTPDPGPGTPEPRGNQEEYTLSLTPQGTPIVRLKHTPKCKGKEYDFDKYFKLEYMSGSLGMKEYPGNEALGDWRNDLPSFRCKGELKSNPWVSFGRSRTDYWYAEEKIGSYTRPTSFSRNIQQPIKISKVKTPQSGICLVKGVGSPAVSVVSKYNGGPASLKVVSIAAIKKVG